MPLLDLSTIVLELIVYIKHFLHGFDYVMTFWAPSMTVLGETFEKAMASGIGQVQRELFADLTECSNGTRYSGSRIY